MAKPAVYLCGPIHGLDMKAAGDWREEATRLLAPDFVALSPLRGRVWTGDDYSHFTDDELVTRDLMDIRRSRAVLRYCPGPSHGSDMETFYAAHVCGIPVVAFGEYVNVPRSKLSLWLRRFTVNNFGTLEEAVSYLKDYWLYPGEAA